MFYIRVDGNPRIGMGHIMRCLAIADAMRLRGRETTFIVLDGHMVSGISERGYSVVVLNSGGRAPDGSCPDGSCPDVSHPDGNCPDGSHSDGSFPEGPPPKGNCLKGSTMESEIPALVSLIKRQNIKSLLVDSYSVTPAYLRKLCELVHVAYIDDLNVFHYPCHLLINYNCYYDKFNYPMRYPQTELLLGCRYAPLRGEFRNLPRRAICCDVKAVLITTGGNDTRNIAGKLVRKAKETQTLKHLVFHIVAGAFNPYIDDLRMVEKKYEDVFVHSHLSQSQFMSQLMLDCDIAVSAGGSTLYELCACGTPTVAFALADNQLDGVASLGNDLMISAGDIREVEDLCMERILDGIFRFMTECQLRLDSSEKMQRLVDGQGALRIAEKLCDGYFGDGYFP